jgi:hypothetical protein
MFIDFKKYNLPIEAVELSEDADYLRLKTSSYTYQFRANGDCCSHSVFKTYLDVSFSSLIGKIIKGVKEIDDFDDDYVSDVDTDDGDMIEKPHLYQMTFKNSDETFKFLMVNYSNGYYDGWITSSVVF